MSVNNINIDPVKACQFIQVASVFGKRASDTIKAYEYREKRAAELRPRLLQQLLDGNLIAEHQKEAAAKLLADPAEVLKLFGKMAAELIKTKTAAAAVTEKQASLGHGVDDPSAGSSQQYTSLTSPFVGQRTGMKKESDLAFERGLGIAQA